MNQEDVTVHQYLRMRVSLNSNPTYPSLAFTVHTSRRPR
jgi:hypothetical protein